MAFASGVGRGVTVTGRYPMVLPQLPLLCHNANGLMRDVLDEDGRGVPIGIFIIGSWLRRWSGIGARHCAACL